MHGRVPIQIPASQGVRPREALESVILRCFEKGRVFVLFSGGRDSSAILATAVHVARREGLPLPVPVTEWFPDLPEANEDRWQSMVIEHLAVSEWLRIDRTRDADLLGEASQASLRRRGLLWPAPLHPKTSLLRLIGPGAVLTGEGGDEIFGPRRITPLHYVHLRRGGSSRREVWTRAAKVFTPGPLRRRSIARDIVRAAASVSPWLRPEAVQESARLIARDIGSEPVHWGRSIRWYPGIRALDRGESNYRLLGQEFDQQIVAPLLEPTFLAALADFGGALGMRSRTAWMEELFSDVLPAPVLRRRSKASFNTAYFGPGVRAFADEWDGRGVDHELVDAERLRQEWLTPSPRAMAAMLLHAAWLDGRQQSAIPG